MRPSCLNCARKHLSQAHVLLMEAEQGYPDHAWLAIGHLAEAADELMQDHADLAHLVRKHRKAVEGSADGPNAFALPVMSLLAECGKRALRGKRAADRGRSMEVPSGCPGCDERKRLQQAAELAGLQARGLASVDLLPSFMRQQQAAEQAGPLAPLQVSQGAVAVEEPAHTETDVAPPHIFNDGCKGLSEWFTQSLRTHRRRSLPLRVEIWATLSNWAPSYSLVSVIEHQALALSLLGVDVKVCVMTNCDMRGCPIPESLVERSIPPWRWEEDRVDGKGYNRLVAWVNRVKGVDAVITHDLLFQSWFVTAAMAIHGLSRVGDSKTHFWHMAHSMGSQRRLEAGVPQEERVRRSLPDGHRGIAFNQDHLKSMVDHWTSDASRFDLLPNIMDVRLVHGVSPRAADLITRHGLHRADIGMVFPVSAPRAEAKGLDQVINALGAARRHGDTGNKVRLVIASAHTKPEHLTRWKSWAHSCDLTWGAEVVATAEEFPDTANDGLPRADISGLFKASNILILPSLSEACSLTVLEAQASGVPVLGNLNVRPIPDRFTRGEINADEVLETAKKRTADNLEQYGIDMVTMIVRQCQP